MAVDPSQLYNPYQSFNPLSGLFSPYGQYFLPSATGGTLSPTGSITPSGAGSPSAGLNLAPYSQAAWYAFSPWLGGGTGSGAPGAAPTWPSPTLFPASTGFTSSPSAGSSVVTPLGTASTSSFPPIPTVFNPGGGGAATPAAPGGTTTPIGAALTGGPQEGGALGAAAGPTAKTPGPGTPTTGLPPGFATILGMMALGVPAPLAIAAAGLMNRGNAGNVASSTGSPGIAQSPGAAAALATGAAKGPTGLSAGFQGSSGFDPSAGGGPSASGDIAGPGPGPGPGSDIGTGVDSSQVGDGRRGLGDF